MITGEPTWTKNDWRMAAKLARADMAMSAEASASLNRSFLDEFVKNGSPIVSVYWPIGNELDTKPLLEFLALNNVATALPRVGIDGAGLYFHRWTWGDALETGPFSLSEPLNDLETLCTPDIVLLPMLGFDADGHRLGYGAGHYDRTLENSKALKVGLAYGQQRISCLLPSEKHDIPLDAVLTPEGVIWFK